MSGHGHDDVSQTQAEQRHSAPSVTAQASTAAGPRTPNCSSPTRRYQSQHKADGNVFAVMRLCLQCGFIWCRRTSTCVWTPGLETTGLPLVTLACTHVVETEYLRQRLVTTTSRWSGCNSMSLLSTLSTTPISPSESTKRYSTNDRMQILGLLPDYNAFSLDVSDRFTYAYNSGFSKTCYFLMVR